MMNVQTWFYWAMVEIEADLTGEIRMMFVPHAESDFFLGKDKAM
jgi:hypothetical protein